MNNSLVILIIILLFIIIVSRLIKNSNLRENFDNPTRQIVIQSNDNIYDKFYAGIYDGLFGDRAKVLFEVTQITKHALKKWGPQNSIKILDAGCGTGWHTKLLSKDYNIIGLDRSAHMINRAKKINNTDVLKLGNMKDSTIFNRNSFTHILCLYYTIYYIDNLNKLFSNFRKWLVPRGMIVLHVVDRDNFDPLLNASSPFPLFSLQKYSKKRLTESKVHFNDFLYKGKFDIDKSNDIATFSEVFKYKNKSKIRKQKHKLYMPNISTILEKARNNGFKLVHKIGLIPVSFEYNYLYIFRKV
jgi:SAM-dependent methyltransferase